MGLGNLGVRVRYEGCELEGQFIVKALLPQSDDKDEWTRVGVTTLVEYEDESTGWEFEEESGRLNYGSTRKIAVGKAMVQMGYARRLGDVLEDNPKEGLEDANSDTE